MPHLVEPLLAVSRPGLRNSSSVPAMLSSLSDSFGPSLQRSGTVAEFVDPDRIMDEECEEVSTPVVLMPCETEMSAPTGVLATPPCQAFADAHPKSAPFCASEDWKDSKHHLTRASNDFFTSPENQDMPPSLPQCSPLVFSPRPVPKQPPVPLGSCGAAAPQEVSTPRQPSVHVQHNPYSTHQPYVSAHYSDSLARADASPFTFEHPFLVRPRNVRGKHPILAPDTATKRDHIVHNPYSFTPTIYTPVELPDSPISSAPTSPTSSNDSTQFSAHDFPSHSALATVSSHSLTASLSSDWSTTESAHPETTNLVYPTAPPPPPLVIDQYYCRPQVFSMPPPQICGPYCGQQQHGYSACSVTPAQPSYSYYEYCASYQQNCQYLCVPSSVKSVDGSSQAGSENGISDDGRSVLSSSTLRTSSQSIISGIEESSTASVLGTEGVKKKRYRARCPTCSTTPDVKRLRFKRGFTYFVCLRCHFKWRLQGAK